MLLEFTLLFCVFFSFWNGFSDAANSISTIVGTRVLSPLKAVLLAACGNLTGVLFGVAVATTIGTGIVEPSVISAKLVLAALAGGTLWEMLTWWFGLPVSESHVLIGGLAGATVAAVGAQAVFFGNIAGLIIIPMVLSPVIAGAFAFLFTGLIVRLFKRHPRNLANAMFNKLQIASAFFLSVTHGANDAQKVAGIMTALLLTEGAISSFHIPWWAIVSSYAAIALGTMLGGWRIVKTMSVKVTRMRPYQGFCAETGSAIVLATTASVGIPVSTTQAISGAIMGVGASRSRTAVRWGVARNIFWTWVFTMPACAVLGWLAWRVLTAAIA